MKIIIYNYLFKRKPLSFYYHCHFYLYEYLISLSYYYLSSISYYLSLPLVLHLVQIFLYFVNLRLFIKSENKKQKQKPFQLEFHYHHPCIYWNGYTSPLDICILILELKKEKIHGKMRSLVVKLVWTDTELIMLHQSWTQFIF